MSAQINNVRSMLKSEIYQINLGRTEYADITLIDRNGNEIAKIEFERGVEENPQMTVTYFNEKGNVTQSITTYDIDA
jgi:hypothetical protein